MITRISSDKGWGKPERPHQLVENQHPAKRLHVYSNDHQHELIISDDSHDCGKIRVDLRSNKLGKYSPVMTFYPDVTAEQIVAGFLLYQDVQLDLGIVEKLLQAWRLL